MKGSMIEHAESNETASLSSLCAVPNPLQQQTEDGGGWRGRMVGEEVGR